MACTINDIMKRDVINVCDAARYGRPRDFEIDVSCGRICAIITGCGGILGLNADSVRIPWDKIVRIGDGVILVDIPPSEVNKDGCETCPGREERRKRHLFF